MLTIAIYGALRRGGWVIEHEETSAFAARIGNLLERIEYRRADSREDKEAIFRLRYESYAREGYIEPNSAGIFTDPDDEVPNAWLIAIFIEKALAASIRLHVASRPEHFLPVTAGFPDIVTPRLEAGDLIVDASRMCSRVEFARVYPFLPYVAIRSAFIAVDHFEADYITAACRPEYQGAYRRMGNAVTWAAPRPYPPLTKLQALMAYDCRRQRDTLRRRYPFAQSTPDVQQALFGASSNGIADAYAELTAGRQARLGERQQSTTCAA